MISPLALIVTGASVAPDWEPTASILSTTSRPSVAEKDSAQKVNTNIMGGLEYNNHHKCMHSDFRNLPTALPKTNAFNNDKKGGNNWSGIGQNFES